MRRPREGRVLPSLLAGQPAGVKVESFPRAGGRSGFGRRAGRPAANEAGCLTVLAATPGRLGTSQTFGEYVQESAGLGPGRMKGRGMPRSLGRSRRRAGRLFARPGDPTAGCPGGRTGHPGGSGRDVHAIRIVCVPNRAVAHPAGQDVRRPIVAAIKSRHSGGQGNRSRAAGREDEQASMAQQRGRAGRPGHGGRGTSDLPRGDWAARWVGGWD